VHVGLPILMVSPSVHRFGVGGAVPVLTGLEAPFPSESRRGTLRKKSEVVEIEGENNMYYDRKNVLYTHVDQAYVYVI